MATYRIYIAKTIPVPKKNLRRLKSVGTKKYPNLNWVPV